MDYIICKEEAFDVSRNVEMPSCIFKSIKCTPQEIGAIKDGWLITGCDRNDDGFEKYYRAVSASAVFAFTTTSIREYENFKLLYSYSFGDMKYYEYHKSEIL